MPCPPPLPLLLSLSKNLDDAEKGATPATLAPDAAPGDTLSPADPGVDAGGEADGAFGKAALPPSGAVYAGLLAVVVAVGGGGLLL